jgi:hypothetical protein
MKQKNQKKRKSDNVFSVIVMNELDEGIVCGGCLFSNADNLIYFLEDEKFVCDVAHHLLLKNWEGISMQLQNSKTRVLMSVISTAPADFVIQDWMIECNGELEIEHDEKFHLPISSVIPKKTSTRDAYQF